MMPPPDSRATKRVMRIRRPPKLPSPLVSKADIFTMPHCTFWCSPLDSPCFFIPGLSMTNTRPAVSLLRRFSPNQGSLCIRSRSLQPQQTSRIVARIFLTSGPPAQSLRLQNVHLINVFLSLFAPPSHQHVPSTFPFFFGPLSLDGGARFLRCRLSFSLLHPFSFLV